MLLGMIASVMLMGFVAMGIGYIVLALANKQEKDTLKNTGIFIGAIIIIISIIMLISQLINLPRMMSLRKNMPMQTMPK